MIDLNFFMGRPRQFYDICYVYPPRIKDIVDNERFGSLKKIVTITHEEIEDQLVASGTVLDSYPTPFQYLLAIATVDPERGKVVAEAFSFFIHETVTFLPAKQSILVGDLTAVLQNTQNANELQKLKQLTEDNFFEFQNLIRNCIGENSVVPPDPDEHFKIKKMKATARYRDRVKTKQQGGLDLSTLLASICCMGIGLNPLNIGEITYASAMLLLNMYQQKEKYDIDIRSIIAGADSKKVKPQYWIHNDSDEKKQ